jgi:PAS domain-containing protein
MEQIRLEGDSPLRAVRTIDPKVNRSFPVELPSAANFVDRHDWGLTPLGARSQWSPLLQTMVSVVLSAAQPMHLIWGPDHTLIYNDGFARILGLKHPIAMGSSFKEVTPDIWEDRLLPMIRDAYQGNALHMTDIELILTRNGYPEEAHFSFSYTPMRESDGQVAGLLVTINETTDAMLENRRLYAGAFAGLSAHVRGPQCWWRGLRRL